MPYILTFIAGCSTLIGYFFIYFKNSNNNLLVSSLGFASGVMFFISLFDLIPESLKLISNNYFILFSLPISIIFIVLGILICILFDKVIPNISINNSNLYHVGIISMIAIIIHNIPEGIATYLTSSFDIKLGITLALSLALHNIPEGISISVPIYYGTGDKNKALFYTFISGMSEFLGAIFASIFLKGSINLLFMGYLYSFIAGIMIYISVCELLPLGFKYKKYFLTFISFLLGIIFIYISINLVK